MRRVDAEVDGDGRDAFVGSCHPVGFRFDLLPHLIEIRELFGFAVQKLGIFWKRSKNKLIIAVRRRKFGHLERSADTERHLPIAKWNQ